MNLNNKMIVLNLIYENKDTLFGKFTNTLTHEDKVQKWKEITDQLIELSIFEKDWKYLRDTTWQNWRKRSVEKRMNFLKTGRKCKYDAADELIYKIMEKDTDLSSTRDVSDPLESTETVEDRVMSPIEIEVPRPVPAAIHINSSKSPQPQKRLRVVNNEFTGIKKQKMEIELELAKVKLEIAKRESYKLDLELLKLERELNITHHSTFSMPNIVMQSDCKYDLDRN